MGQGESKEEDRSGTKLDRSNFPMATALGGIKNHNGESLKSRQKLLVRALNEIDESVSARRYPYKMFVVESDDQTRASLILQRGFCPLLCITNILGTCILGILIQKFIFPWFFWAVHVSVDEKGNITIKFQSGPVKCVLFLTCVMTTCVLVYFSNKEYHEVREELNDACKAAITRHYKVKTQLLMDIPEVIDHSPANLKELFFGKDENTEDEFLYSNTNKKNKVEEKV